MKNKSFRKSFCSLGIIILIISLSLPLDAIGQGRGNAGERPGGGPPPWAPAHGYRAKTRHIFFPEFNFYFDITKGVYIYLSGTKWLTNQNPPVFLSGINLKTTKQIELDVNINNPQKFNKDHIVKYKVKPAKNKAIIKAAPGYSQPGKGHGKGKKH